jgi:hypothetical protein
MDRNGFVVDEEPLRACVLKAYHEKRKAPGSSKRVIDAIRQFLSGAPGGKTVLRRYWFEEDPPASIASFFEDLEKASAGLTRNAIEPLITAVRQMEEKKSRTLAPHVSVYVSSLAGPVALKAKIDETLACAVVSAAIIGLSRLGRGPFEAALEGVKA